MENQKEVEINENDVFADAETLKIRRVIAKVGDVIVYSKGTDKNGACTEKNFRRWLAGKTVQRIYQAAGSVQTEV